MLGVSDGWNHVGRVLAQALTYLDQVKCPRGHYTDESTQYYMAGRYEIDDDTVCEACAAHERYLEDLGDNKPQPGTLLTLHAYHPDDD